MKTYKILTLEQLVRFCEENKFYSFDSKNTGYKLCVQIPGVFEQNLDSTKGLLHTKLKVCHTLLNRNGSFISEDNMKKYMPSLKNRPVLAHIHQLDDGNWDFHSHDIKIVEDENGEEQFEYIERQIGSFTEDDPYLEYDEKMKKTYVMANAAIPEDYTMAADIIRRKNGTKVSCELAIESFSYNAKEKYLEIEDFYFLGVTCLGCEKDGTEIGEGMLGSRLDIMDFSMEKNSVCSKVDYNEKLIAALDNLTNTITNLNINTNQKGGTLVTKFEELLEKYGKTVEDITFEYENMSDEELETKFAEVFENDDTEDEGVDPEPNSDGEEDETANDNNDDDIVITEESLENNSITDVSNNLYQKTFELSHEDIRYALYNLLSTYEEADNEWYYITGVYDNYFVYESWSGGQIYGQKYIKDGDNVSFDGERYNLHKVLLTDSEYAELENMRSNYAQIKSKLDEYQLKEENTAKDALFELEDYSSIYSEKEFIELKENHSDISLNELQSKLDSILLSCAKSGKFSFAAEHVENTNKGTRKTALPFNEPKKKGRYGNIFSK